MREIKFRAWSHSQNEMFGNGMLEKSCGGLLKIAKKFMPNLPQGEEGLYLPLKDKDLVFMQYTGLKDKNGREIYEGDVLRDRESYDEIYHYRVIWSESNCCFYFKDVHGDYECFGGEDLYLNQIEVIGNIYEHPYLIESPQAPESTE